MLKYGLAFYLMFESTALLNGINMATKANVTLNNKEFRLP